MNWELLSIPGVVADLVLDPIIVGALKRTLGRNARRRLEELSDGAPLTSLEEGLLRDTIQNDARLYVRFTGRGSYGGYHIDIVGLGGIYFVRANEFGKTGLYDDLDEAEEYVIRNWGDNLVSSCARRYRDEFGLSLPRPRTKPQQAPNRTLKAR